MLLLTIMKKIMETKDNNIKREILYRENQLVIYEEKHPDGKIKLKYGFIDKPVVDEDSDDVSYYVSLIKGTNIFKISKRIKVSQDDICLP